MNDVWRYELTPPAMRDLERLDKPARRRILEALDRLVARSGYGDVRKLASTVDEYRLRVGKWRLRFTVRQAIEGDAHIHRVVVEHVFQHNGADRNA